MHVAWPFGPRRFLHFLQCRQPAQNDCCGAWFALSCVQWITGARTGIELSGAHRERGAEARGIQILGMVQAQRQIPMVRTFEKTTGISLSQYVSKLVDVSVLQVYLFHVYRLWRRESSHTLALLVSPQTGSTLRKRVTYRCISLLRACACGEGTSKSRFRLALVVSTQVFPCFQACARGEYAIFVSGCFKHALVVNTSLSLLEGLSFVRWW